ncbi:MAG: hypothetical protein ACYDHB_03440 [Candidatus Dormibacteria bacterium]
MGGRSPEEYSGQRAGQDHFPNEGAQRAGDIPWTGWGSLGKAPIER